MAVILGYSRVHDHERVMKRFVTNYLPSRRRGNSNKVITIMILDRDHMSSARNTSFGGDDKRVGHCLNWVVSHGTNESLIQWYGELLIIS